MEGLRKELEEKTKFDVDELIKKQTQHLKLMSLTKEQRQKFLQNQANVQYAASAALSNDDDSDSDKNSQKSNRSESRLLKAK